jgi:hypothetical protein
MPWCYRVSVRSTVSIVRERREEKNAPGLPYAFQQLPQRHLGCARNLDLLARLEALLEVGLLHLPRHVPPHVGCLRAQSPRQLAVALAPAHIFKVRRLARMRLDVIVAVVVGAVDQRVRVFAGDALLLVGGRAGDAVSPLGQRDAALGLAAGDAPAQLADLVDEMDAVGRLGVLGADVQVEMAPQARRGEGLAAERAVLVLCRLELRRLRGGGARGRAAVLGLAHGDGCVALVLVLGFETSGSVRFMHMQRTPGYHMINAGGGNGRRGERGTCHARQCSGQANERTQRALQAKGAATRRNYCLRAAWRRRLPLNA